MLFRRFIILIIVSIIPLCATAQMVQWKTDSQYSSIEPLSPSLLRICQYGNYGIMDINGRVIVEPHASAVTDMAEGASLILSGDKLIGVVQEDGTWIKAKTTLYVDASYPYYSDGLLAVRRGDKNWTFVDRNLEQLFSPQFNFIWPYVCGTAKAKFKSGVTIHIDRNGRIKKLGDGFTNKDIILASSFTKFEKGYGALLVDSDNNVFLRDLTGNLVGNFGKMTNYDKNTRSIITTKYKRIEFADNWQIKTITDNSGNTERYEIVEHKPFQPSVGSISSTSRGGYYNLMVNGREVLTYQFDNRPIAMSSKLVLVEKDGKRGLIELLPEYRARLEFPSNSIVYRHHNPMALACSCPVPSSFRESDFVVNIQQKGQNVFVGTPRKGVIELSYFPEDLSERSGDAEFDYDIEVAGLRYSSSSSRITWLFKNAFSVSTPGRVRLNKSNTNGSFTVAIKNEADSESDECDIIIDGNVVQRGVVFSPSETKNFNYNKRVDLEDLDNIAKTVTIQVKENGCPLYKENRRIVFERNYQK